jgi:hypothetical protein
MKRLIYLFAAMLVLQMQTAAQSKEKIKFYSITQAGLLAGGSTNSLQLQTTNGVRFGTFSAGAGVGIDYYHFKTIPLFVDVRKNLWNRDQTPFMYFDFGTNLPWQRSVSESDWARSKFDEGFFYDIGIGYKWKLKGRLGLNASFGYSQKNVQENRQERFWSGPPMPVTWDESWNSSHFKYSFRRLGFKIGLSF